MKNNKFQRQKVEYNRQLGHKIINDKINFYLTKINKQNFEKINYDVKSFVKRNKQKYGIKNILKNERIYNQTINILQKN